MSASHFDSRHIFSIYHVRTYHETWVVFVSKKVPSVSLGRGGVFLGCVRRVGKLNSCPS